MVNTNLSMTDCVQNSVNITKRGINCPHKAQDYLNNKEYTKTKHKTPFMVFHQNIRSVHGTIDELLNLWTNKYPHTICLTEHHLHKQEFDHLFWYQVGR
jgi:hypothetical protein